MILPNRVIYNRRPEDLGLNSNTPDQVVSWIVNTTVQQHELAIRNALANAAPGVKDVMVKGPPVQACIPRDLFPQIYQAALEAARAAPNPTTLSWDEIGGPSTSINAVTIALSLCSTVNRVPASKNPGMSALTPDQNEKMMELIHALTDIVRVAGRENPSQIDLTLRAYTDPEWTNHIVNKALESPGEGKMYWVAPSSLEELERRGKVEIIQVDPDQPRTHLVKFTHWEHSDLKTAVHLFEQAIENRGHPVEGTVSSAQLSLLRFLVEKINSACGPEIELHEERPDPNVLQQRDAIRISLTQIPMQQDQAILNGEHLKGHEEPSVLVFNDSPSNLPNEEIADQVLRAAINSPGHWIRTAFTAEPNGQLSILLNRLENERTLAIERARKEGSPEDEIPQVHYRMVPANQVNDPTPAGVIRLELSVWSKKDEMQATRIVREAFSSPGRPYSAHVTRPQLRAVDQALHRRPPGWDVSFQQGRPYSFPYGPEKLKISIYFTKREVT